MAELRYTDIGVTINLDGVVGKYDNIKQDAIQVILESYVFGVVGACFFEALAPDIHLTCAGDWCLMCGW